MTPDELRKTKVGSRPENAGALAGLQTQKPKPPRGSEGEDRQLEEVPQGVGYRITFVVLSKRRMDEHDNLRSSVKPYADFITAALGFKSDDDPALEWHYRQLTSTGAEGTIVKIDVI
jgi:hypothetical protein